MDEGTLRRSTRIRIGLTVGAFAAAAAMAMAAASWFVADERARDMRAWQVRLDLIADSRANDIGQWLDRQFATLSSVADNASVQLYVMQLSPNGDQAATAEPAERSYLRNLLIVTAEHGGFQRVPTAPTVPANVERTSTAGLAIVDREGRMMVATPGMPEIDDSWRALLTAAAPGRATVRDLYAGPGDAPMLGFAAPIYRVQGDGNPDQQIAWAIGIKDVAPELYPLLRQPGTTEKTLETELVRQVHNVVEYLSPLLDGGRPLERRSEADADHLAEAAAVDRPGAIGILRDYRDEPVLFTSRTLPHVPWILVEKIDRTEALANSDVRANRLLFLFAVSILAVGGTFIAVWRHGASVRANEAADRYRATARELDHQKRLLTLVTDSVPDSIFIVGPDAKLTFANKSLGDRFGIAAGDLNGKTLASVFGPEEARRYADATTAAAASNGAVIARTDRSGDGPTLHVSQTRSVTLARGGSRRSGVLVLDSDITEVVRVREKHEAMLQRLVTTLVKIVDQRDPSAVGQSERVAAISAEIAREMKLDALAVETAATAGRLVNFWKVLVPSDVLTRPGPLSDNEANASRQAALKWADFVDGIGFDGPVAETLRQVHEHHNGSGWPKHLREGQVLIAAQIVALANQVVAMTSDRAYRKGADIADVARLIAQDAGRRYHPGVVAAFLNALENGGGRERWSAAS